ncbi:uncharacterized protein LOC143296434 isoform X2 [Babylonia areolata]
MAGSRIQTDAVAQHRLGFRSAAMEIDNSLYDDDVDGMKFLCQGLVVGSKLKRTDTAHELISLLESAGQVSDVDFFLLADLLQYVQRIDVLEKIGFEETEVMLQRRALGSKVNPFYVLLFQIAEELPEEDVRKASYMYGKVPRSQKVSTGTELFTLMVQHNAIAPDKVDLLLKIFGSIERQDIVELINRYTATQGGSVMADLERTFTRAMSLRGIDIGDRLDPRPQPQPQREPNIAGGFGQREPNIAGGFGQREPNIAGGFGHGMGPSIYDVDVKGREPALSTQVSEEPSSMSNNPPSETPLSPSAPPPSMPSFPSGHHSFVQTHTHSFGGPRDPSVASSVPAVSTAPEGFGNYAIPWPILHIVSKNVPAKYWEEISARLGVPVTTNQSSNTQMNYNHCLSVLKRWLDLPETHAMDELGVRTFLVKALAFSGPQLIAEEIASKLNIDFRAIMQESRLTMLSSAYDENDVASTGSAVPEAMDVIQTVSLGNDPGALVSRQVTSPIPLYRMNRMPRGLCIIINNRDFYKDPAKMEARQMISREGTNVDRDKLKETFERLNFQVIGYDNCTDYDMLQIMQRVAVQDHLYFDCFVCCILTHGVLGALYGVNGMTVPIRDMTSPFRSQACPSLAGKPKLFFMQACQGRDKQEGHLSDMEVDSVEADGPPEMIPNEADFLLGYATVPGFVSYRSKTQGSWYITKLTDLLNKHAYDHDILDILTLVNYEVGKGDARIDDGTYKQSPAPMYSLRKKLIFARPSSAIQ